MIIIPKLNLIEKEGTIYIEVLVKTLPIGNVISSTDDIVSIIVQADNDKINLVSSKDSKHWCSTRDWKELRDTKNYKLTINTGYAELTYNCGLVYWDHK